MKPAISIRKATDIDAPSIREMIFNIWKNEYHFQIQENDYPDLYHIETHYLDDNNLFLIAENKQQHIVGTIACSALKKDYYVLKRMFVSKNFRRYGIAQALLNELFNRIVYSYQRYKAVFVLSTKRDQAIAAEQFYLKNGFHEISMEDLPQNFPFFYQDDLFMLKNIWIKE